MPRQTTIRRLCLISVTVGLVNCGDGYQHFTLHGGPQSRVRVVNDSPLVAAMVQHALDEEREYFRGLSSPKESERLATFLQSGPGKLYNKLKNDFQRAPGYDVPGQTRFKLLFESNVLPYSKVEFDSGPVKGQIGWMSRADFDDTRTGSS